MMDLVKNTLAAWQQMPKVCNLLTEKHSATPALLVVAVIVALIVVSAVAEILAPIGAFLLMPHAVLWLVDKYLTGDSDDQKS